MAITPRNIHLIAPSGYCHNQPAARLGVARLRGWGHRVDNTAVIERRDRRFAGDDDTRLADINRLASMAELPDIVLAVRGGYGASRLLPRLNYAALGERLRDAPLALCGHSDFTAIQLALLAQCGVKSFSGPMLAANFGPETLNDFTLACFWQALSSESFTLDWQTSEAAGEVNASGTVWGGNLAMIASLVGTPYLPAIDGGILVIEDINEHPFRTERMLLQLLRSGVLARQQAIITGSFTGATLSDYDGGYDFPDVWQLIRDLTGLPVVSGLAFGHAADTVTLPLGAHGRLAVSDGHAALTLSDYPQLR
ncbi:muramoyltetrapeptide carboxypeptidase [Erwinia sp. Leaf53]|uniref:muramoyltetrapeptide carboxypeptidase n=1 Tax=Erwinia sp. Leaf53 TaxID=1736225 RepID=UPI0006FFA193|nr:muramoyltetrapeptide carboxypeptidase [Erwinia sp. Leaf53]KQN63484.1 LD-carboxypeptidase [Erwinia sp. Leaf53]